MSATFWNMRRRRAALAAKEAEETPVEETVVETSEAEETPVEKPKKGRVKKDA